MARKATWQRHVDPRSAPTWREYILYSIILININGSLSSPIWGGSYPYKRSGIIYPTVSINKVRVGLIFFTYLPCRRRGATTAVGSSGWVIDERRSGERGTIDRGSTHVLINRYYNGWISATWQHRTRRSRGSRVHRRSIST